MAHLLKDLGRQTARDQIGEILLFQNGECQATKRAAQSFLSRLNLKIFSSPGNHLGRSRAFLVEKSRYDLIAWTDADCRLEARWLEALLSHWLSCKNSRPVVAIGGPNRLPEDKFWKKIFNLSLLHPLGHGFSPQAWAPPGPAKVSHIPTTNGLFSRVAVLKAGNFSLRHKKAGEDKELGQRLKKQGALLLFPTPLVLNNCADSYWDSLKRLWLFGKQQAAGPDARFLPALLLAPFVYSSLIMGFAHRLFWIPAGFYMALLLTAGLSLWLKRKIWGALIVPLFWFCQHSAYSIGALAGFFACRFSSGNGGS